MTTTKITVDNLKCNGCAHTIKKEISRMQGVSWVGVDIESRKVTIVHADLLMPDDIKQELAQLGYPEEGSLHGVGKLAANAKSFVSCAVGRFS